MANSTLNMIPGVKSDINKIRAANAEKTMREMRNTPGGTGGRWSNGNFTENPTAYAARMKEQKTTLQSFYPNT